MWGRAKTTPRPAPRYPNAARICPVSCTPPMSLRHPGITGSRNASSQYRAYERMACLASARSSPPGAWSPRDPAQVTLKYLHPGALVTPGTVGCKPESPLGPRFGQAAHHRPAETIPGIGQPVPESGAPVTS